MSDFIEIKIDNEELQRALNQLAEKTSNLRPLMKNIAGILEDSVEENFEQQGRPKWKGLAKSTIVQRTKKGYYPGKILQMRGELASSITSSQVIMMKIQLLSAQTRFMLPFNNSAGKPAGIKKWKFRQDLI